MFPCFPTLNVALLFIKKSALKHQYRYLIYRFYENKKSVIVIKKKQEKRLNNLNQGQ